MTNSSSTLQHAPAPAPDSQLPPSLDYQAARWLASQENDPAATRRQWWENQPALIHLGLHFEAIRLPAAILHRIAGANSRDRIESTLRDRGIDSAVIADSPRRWYYALVPPGTAAQWRVRGIEALGADSLLGVPAPHYSEGPGTYWLLAPPDNDSMLCDPDAVRKLISSDRQAEGDAS